jgi:hypothetical protein
MQDTSAERDLFWSYNPTVLFDKKRLVEFTPTADMTQEEKLNAVTRLTLYIGIVMLAYTRAIWALYIPILGMFFTLFLYQMSRKQRGEKHPTPRDPTLALKDNDIILRPPFCTPPTRENPFMNITMDEYNSAPDRPAACEYPGVDVETNDHFNYDLYKDIDDLWEKNNGQRQFFTMPYTTIPNDQGSFAKWLYDVPQTCKEDSSNCLRYEDVRANRPTFGDSEYLT